MNNSEGSSLPTVLVVDDEKGSQDAIRRTLEEDFTVLMAGSAEEARALLSQHEIAVILCDQRMPGTTGVQLLKEVRERWPDVVRIIISGYTDTEDIIAGINDAGIYQYVLKPWMPDHLLDAVRGAVEARILQLDMHRLDLELRTSTSVLRARAEGKRTLLKSTFDFDRIIRVAGSPMDGICELAARVARYDLSVVVLGESGTGKELLARAIHYASPRAEAMFVIENCGAIADNLLESELFGHKRGSFTGAYEDHIGIFQRADGGTVFLDEIGDTSHAFQVKLLRVLQEGEVRPVGGTRTIPINVRVIAATHRDLEQEVHAGRFRQDLYYRLAGMTLTMPPLRERPGDIVPIAEALLAQASQELKMPARRFAPDAMASLITYPWPGNVRELRNEIYRALTLTLNENAEIDAQAFSSKVLQGHPAMTAGIEAAAGISGMRQTGTLQERLEVVEAAILKETLLRFRWNKTHSAKELGLSRVGLRNKMLRLGLEKK
ncbi:sigma-54 dependent transcriptional regulator [Herbaspirillum sp. RTI4]|uniref:sigma-54-dependent transcriptional regulator n=1 Tax=Herbaspirillum sp. RTI4 TaxID=3048640 RepID=UPI002AB53410|nr:sigma-54 dependent transcriptional regulator [Herbaspirillum sp. RTI4]MDY7577056.1 sigma-54 dependent transcriptional regulator [Herbaspirillum sp. RTI4]MEA9982236.1 sigma-54 dependent transcriptional regulator [Herbaspirillum sp. RTI4]